VKNILPKNLSSKDLPGKSVHPVATAAYFSLFLSLSIVLVACQPAKSSGGGGAGAGGSSIGPRSSLPRRPSGPVIGSAAIDQILLRLVSLDIAAGDLFQNYILNDISHEVIVPHPIWYHEVTGADLAQSFLENRGADPREVRVGLIDVGCSAHNMPDDRKIPGFVCQGYGATQDHHGAKTAQLIIGMQPISYSHRAQLTGIWEWHNSPMILLGDVVHQIQAQAQSELVNMSMHVADTPDNRAALRALSRTSIVVVAAGNQHENVPLAPGQNRDVAETLLPVFQGWQGGIVVGSIGPDGRKVRYSQQGAEVTLLAPDSGEFQSYTMVGDFRVGALDPFLQAGFNGTSNATPQVTSALANAISVFPADFRLSAAEAKILLQRTAVPTSMSRANDRLNGAGSLNAYQLVRVTQRLVDTLWHLDEPADRLQRLADPNLYDFEIEATELIQDAEREMLNTGSVESNLVQKNQFLHGFDDLRRAFFLNPTGYARRWLHRIREYQNDHRQAGQPEQPHAGFYRRP
jgi:hypothetical protein